MFLSRAFAMAQPLRTEVARLFPRERELLCDAKALGYHALLLGSFGLLCHDLLSPALFVIVGVCAYVRNFNAIHESSHASHAEWNPLRRLSQAAMIVHGPLQLGRREVISNHRQHHTYPADPTRDPGASVNCGDLPRASVNSFIQPELAVVQYIRREGRLSSPLRRALAYNIAFTAALIALGGVNFLWWLVVTRLGSTAVWLVFDWVLHHPVVWGHAGLAGLPPWLTRLWSALFSRDNLNASRHHELHHRYPQVADHALPVLAEFLAQRGPAGAMAPRWAY